MNIVISTNSGTEDLLIRELEKLGYRGVVLRPAKVMVKGKERDVVRLNFWLRQAHRVFLLLNEGRIENLDDVYRIAKEINYSEYFNEKRSFAVRGRRFGKHPFTSVDAAAIVGKAVVEHFKGKIKANLKNPEVEIYVDISEDICSILLNTSGESLHKRYGKRKHHAPLKPSMASSLIYYSSFEKRRYLFDPMCGSGTIPLEGAGIIQNIPPGVYRKAWMYQNLDLEFPEPPKFRVRDPGFAEGSDVNPSYVREASKIWKSLKVKPEGVYFSVGDATKRELLPLVITNPPYGIRMGSPKKIRRLYRKFVENLVRNEVEEVVALTADLTLEKELKKHYRVERKRVLYGSLESFILKGII
jgi:tRNA (guanine6-N2)-methyltransferase